MTSFEVKIKLMHWSTDTKILKKNPKKYAVWQLEQAVNFGLGSKKIKQADLKKYWSKLRLDPAKKNYLQFLLWPKKQS